MDSLKMHKQYPIFSEGFTETMSIELYFEGKEKKRIYIAPF